MPHFGQGAFLGAQWTGITRGVGASVPMVCISGGEDSQYPHSPGCRPYLSRAKRLGSPAVLVEISAKSLKKRVRGIRPIERQAEKEPDDNDADTVRDYCAAVRAALTDEGVPPLAAAGVELAGRLN